MNTPHIEEVIITTRALRGDGKRGSPVRRVLQVFRRDGQLIAERDEWREQHLEALAGETAAILDEAHTADVASFDRLRDLLNRIRRVIGAPA